MTVSKRKGKFLSQYIFLVFLPDNWSMYTWLSCSESTIFLIESNMPLLTQGRVGIFPPPSQGKLGF